MRPSKLFTTAGVVSLVVGPVAVLVQYLFTPISGDLEVAKIVEKAAQHHDAMRTALLLDIPAMLVIPDVLFVGYLVDSRTSTFAGVATGLCLVPAIGGVVLFANDAVGAGRRGRRPPDVPSRAGRWPWRMPRRRCRASRTRPSPSGSG